MSNEDIALACGSAPLGVKIVFNLEKPKIALLNIGIEDVKGTEFIKKAMNKLKEAENLFNLHGFVEGDGIVDGSVDVVVTDGFTGNVALKTIEGTAKLTAHYLKLGFTKSILAKIGYLLVSPSLKSTFKKMMSEMYGMKLSTNEAVSYRDYKKDPTSTPQQKVNKGIAEVNAMLSEMEKIVANNLRLKTEMGVQSNHFWKSTGMRFAKINERMTRIANKLKELSQ